LLQPLSTALVWMRKWSRSNRNTSTCLL